MTLAYILLGTVLVCLSLGSPLTSSPNLTVAGVALRRRLAAATTTTTTTAGGGLALGRLAAAGGRVSKSIQQHGPDY